MAHLKYVILVLILISTCYSETELTKDHWLDIETMNIRRDKSIQHITRTGKIIPAITLIEIKDGRLAAILSLNTPGFLNNHKKWTEDFQVIYKVKDIKGKKNSRITGELDGFSFDVPNGKWISSLTFLPPENILKDDVENIIIQAKKTPERMAILSQREIERIAREKATDEILVNIPFPNNVIGESFDFELNMHNGDVFNSKEHRGKVILLDFWSIHCAPCLRAMPKLRELSKKYPKDKFEIIGINFDDYENIDDILKQHNINWPQWVVKQDAMQSAIYKKLNFKGIPYYMFIDQSGILVKQGYSLEVELISDVIQLLE